MIKIEEDCEFITMIADLIKLLGNLKDDYKLKIWVSGCESPFEFSSDENITFLNEGIRFHKKIRPKYLENVDTFSYIFYDSIVNILVVVKHEY